MSTSDPLQHVLLSDPASVGGASPAGNTPSGPTGFFDPAVLARMANEFFTALPASFSDPAQQAARVVPASDSAGIPALASVSATPPAAAPEVSLPSDLHFAGVPASAGAASISPISTPVQAAPPAIPGATAGSIPSQSSSGIPAFSFLQDVHPIVADTSTVPSPAYPQARPITEFPSSASNPGAVPAFDPEFTPDLPAGFSEYLNPPSPALPASLAPVDSSAVPAFSFLEDARPLFSYPPSVPGPAPASDQLPFGFLDARTITSPEAPATPAAATLEPNVPENLALSSYEFDAMALKRDFPILRERGERTPAGMARQRGDNAKAAICHRSPQILLRA